MSDGTDVRWLGHPLAPAPIATLRAARRRDARARLVDDRGIAIPFGPAAMLRETVRAAWLAITDAVVAMAAGLLTSTHRPRHTPGVGGPGPVVLVLPVLPDLSHTFVYREVLALLRQRPDWRVVVLEKNVSAPVHPEAAELLQRAEFLAPRGITGRALAMLKALGTVGGRALFAMYRADAGGGVRDLLGKNPLRDPRHPANAFLLAERLAATGGKPRHLHVYGSTYSANVVMGAAMLLGVPFSISSYVDFEFPYAHKLLVDKLHRATFFRVVTDFCATRLGELLAHEAPPRERTPTLLLGLDLARWRERATPPRRGVLVSAARLVPKKGLHLMPPALAELRSRGVAWRWRVAGDGPELARLQALCAEHGVADAVDFLGACDNARVRREILAADAAVLPCVVAADGERDGIPIFLCEAMALGVPVVTTPISGIPELVTDGASGLLCKPGSVGALADALQRICTDHALADALAARGRAVVHERLDVDRIAAELVRRIEA